MRVLLTVSPVPLAATAAIMCWWRPRKARRRCAPSPAIWLTNMTTFYFPSYEVITGQPARHGLYAPDLRNVVQAGVDTVMQHFFCGRGQKQRCRLRHRLVAPKSPAATNTGEEALLGIFREGHHFRGFSRQRAVREYPCA